MKGSASCTTSYWPSPPSTGTPPPATSSSSKATPTASASAPAWVSGLEQQRNGQWRTVRSLSRTPDGSLWPTGTVERGERLLGTVRVPWCGWSAGGRDRDQSVSNSAPRRGPLPTCQQGNAVEAYASDC